MTSDLYKNGFLILRNAISPKLNLEIQKIIISFFKKKNKNKSNYGAFEDIVLKSKIKKEYNFVAPLNDLIYSKNLVENIFLEKKIYKTLCDILGKDLCYLVDNVLTLNIPNKESPEKNYHFKDWHQEIWSGADISTLQFWTPLFQKNNKTGQMDFIIGSHKWGHIPHSNRKPLNLPEKFRIYRTNLNIGDIVLFTTTLVHRSVGTSHPRMALPVLIKNFKYNNYSFERNRNWKIFSYAELTKIERALGNHYLSPYRIMDQNVKFEQGTIKK